ncbi:MAG: type II toxin-antitoxin system VapB family antitoxin [Candidatus Dormibacteraeota bacterium]|uniref:Type II toxin-antitoxin system VapB family antitoxin n=1 Tax=Candidatus Dormiibacter inghamiae TaxID=3127013 RepID=A0A934KE02_9BACT|nr:type II toxin-antitoxin system VapB family antitoxin [Candidatus Dormibacteraeota bacterium]MBJ7606026.1 type II toxin-antitoxin system VapB family antitoxin [Candidatus Dormibacteraeota bacterium]
MRKTTIAVDDDKVSEAARALGTRSLKETVDRSLDEVVAMAARRRLIDRFSRPTDLADDEVMASAWRD